MKWEHFTDSKPISYREYAIILVESSKYFCEQVFFCGTQGELASVCVHSVLKPLKSASVSHLLLPPTGSPRGWGHALFSRKQLFFHLVQSSVSWSLDTVSESNVCTAYLNKWPFQPPITHWFCSPQTIVFTFEPLHRHHHYHDHACSCGIQSEYCFRINWAQWISLTTRMVFV